MKLLLLLSLCFASIRAEDEIVALKWNVSMSTIASKRTSSRHILTDVCGKAVKGKLHAIMGPSGSGKSSLLNSLAGVVAKKSVNLEGTILNVVRTEPVFIQQEDLLFAQLTVAETLDCSSALRKSDESVGSRTAAVDSTILKLGLKKSRNVRTNSSQHQYLLFNIGCHRLLLGMPRREVYQVVRRNG
jgi:ABC-type multidrug transport system ATPase subunit